MNIEEYKELQKCGFISNFRGEIINLPFDPNDVPYDREKVAKTLYKQLNEEVDFKNVIILFPLATGFGRNGLFGKDKICIDHPSYIVSVREILRKAGIKFKSGEELNDEKYRQNSFSLLVVHNGEAYVSSIYTDPLNSCINYLCSERKDIKNIHINQSEIKNLDIHNKKIFFSGFFKENKFCKVLKQKAI